MSNEACDRCKVNARKIRTVDQVLCVECYMALKERASREEAAWLGQRRADAIPV